MDPRLAAIFNSTQGNHDPESKQLLPHREPFKTTQARYQSLQREWNFFLINNPSQIDDATLQKWGQQADRLTVELQNLIEEPTARNLFSTQLSLRSLRQQFPYLMSQTKGVDVYQVKVWQNRLDTLDRLLSYGERKTFNSY